jgi:hypothetical protein
MSTQDTDSKGKKEQHRSVRFDRELSGKLSDYVHAAKRKAENPSDVSVNETIKTAVREFLYRQSGERPGTGTTEPYSGLVLNDNNAIWHQKLDAVLNSGKKDAIEAVQNNLDVFYRYAAKSDATAVPINIESGAAKRTPTPKRPQ